MVIDTLFMNTYHLHTFVYTDVADVLAKYLFVPNIAKNVIEIMLMLDLNEVSLGKKKCQDK